MIYNTRSKCLLLIISLICLTKIPSTEQDPSFATKFSSNKNAFYVIPSIVIQYNLWSTKCSSLYLFLLFFQGEKTKKKDSLYDLKSLNVKFLFERKKNVKYHKEKLPFEIVNIYKAMINHCENLREIIVRIRSLKTILIWSNVIPSISIVERDMKLH